jgi:hypothetical protein
MLEPAANRAIVVATDGGSDTRGRLPWCKIGTDEQAKIDRGTAERSDAIGVTGPVVEIDDVIRRSEHMSHSRRIGHREYISLIEALEVATREQLE